jgi:CRISPR-associated protein (TIGR03986 family)
MIKAPFNFVPISDTVFSPYWAEQISHDIPFSDGESGVIELKITAHSPIFVRNGHTKEDAKNKTDDYKSFSKINNKYFIPGTSIKGAVRNVLEIMSFGKMRLDRNAMFAQRDWEHEDIYPMKRQQKEIRCGWLKRDGINYQIIDCGEPYRIGHKRIDEKLKTKIMEKYFSKAEKFDLTKKEYIYNGKKFDPKTASFKYELVKNYEFITKDQKFNIDMEFYNKYKKNRLVFADNGSITGTLVFTGQPDQWIWKRPTKPTGNAGKYYEFVFPKPNEGLEPISFTKDEFNHFKFIYSESSDWKMWENHINNKGIPVFFRTGPERINNKNVLKIKDLGLAFLYKLPYDRSPFETLKPSHQENKPDLADCIFGYTNDKKSLKGRVQFSAASSDNAQKNNDVILTLSSPKASYYPIYIKQDGNDGKVLNYNAYNTYNNGQISGWKRYPVRKKIWENKSEEYTETRDTVIHPLKDDAIFKGKIYFHNLKKVELGALLSALTFHNNMDKCYHQIGQGKPYGFGKVKMEVTFLNKNLEQQKEELMASFENAISLQLNEPWHLNDSIKELFTMAKEEVTDDDVLFEYMQMNNVKTKNEFLIAKGAVANSNNLKIHEYLQLYSVLKKKKFSPQSIWDEKKAEIEMKQKELEKEEQEEILKKPEDEKNKKRTGSLILGAKYNVGDSVKIIITCEKPKKGIIVGSDVEVQIVTRLPLNAENEFMGKVKQKANDGRIIQVEI